MASFRFQSNGMGSSGGGSSRSASLIIFASDFPVAGLPPYGCCRRKFVPLRAPGTLLAAPPIVPARVATRPMPVPLTAPAAPDARPPMGAVPPGPTTPFAGGDTAGRTGTAMPIALTTLSAPPAAAAFPPLIGIALPTAFRAPLPEAFARAMAARTRSSTRAPMALIAVLPGNALKRRAGACGPGVRASVRAGFLPGGRKDGRNRVSIGAPPT